MKKIELYLDETKGHQMSFRISVPIWGSSINCNAYKNEIKTIVDSSTILGNDFKGFHAYNLSDSNWHTIGKVYISVINKFKEYVLDNKLNFMIRIEAKEVYEKNGGYLKAIAKKGLQERDSELGKIFTSLKDKDIPALYHRIDQLIIYLKYRDKFGGEDAEFDFYPDSEGKILKYENKQFTVQGNHFVDYPLDFYDIIKIWGNSLTKVILELIPNCNWPNINQKLNKFEPKKSTDDFIIQTCDIISNFFFCYINDVIGINNDKNKLKGKAINDLIPLSEFQNLIQDSFKKGLEDEVICTNQDLKALIEVVNQ
ncbi:MAG: hypothetical protein V1773_10735 [bacterium]